MIPCNPKWTLTFRLRLHIWLRQGHWHDHRSRPDAIDRPGRHFVRHFTEQLISTRKESVPVIDRVEQNPVGAEGGVQAGELSLQLPQQQSNQLNNNSQSEVNLQTGVAMPLGGPGDSSAASLGVVNYQNKAQAQGRHMLNGFQSMNNIQAERRPSRRL